MNTGVIEGLSANDYHKIDALSATALNELSKSPLHYWARFIDPERKTFEPTEAMKLGTLVHTVVLEPKSIFDRYAIIPDDAPRRPTNIQMNAKKPSPETLSSILWWEKFDAESAGREIVKTDTFLTAHRAASALMKSNTAELLFQYGQPEVTLVWNDRETGLKCKCRLDWLSTIPAVVELKTTVDASPGFQDTVDIGVDGEPDLVVRSGFARQVANFEYHLRLAHYLDGLETLMGEAPPYIFAAIETKPPFPCGFFTPDKELVELGRRRRAQLQLRYLACKAKREWQGYPDAILTIGAPSFLRHANAS